jgi:hypothetical protein
MPASCSSRSISKPSNIFALDLLACTFRKYLYGVANHANVDEETLLSEQQQEVSVPLDLQCMVGWVISIIELHS